MTQVFTAALLLAGLLACAESSAVVVDARPAATSAQLDGDTAGCLGETVVRPPG